MVIAASHMRMPNDYVLAEQCGELIDIILGGHDHHYEDTIINHLHILNSGSDFSDFTLVKVNAKDDLSTQRVTITKDMEEDAATAEIVRHFSDEAAKNMEIIIGSTKVDLDARFSEIRTKETNISNFFASILTHATNADVTILNSGSIRADRMIHKGILKVQDLCDLLPVADPVAVVALTGFKLVAALENGVSQYPAMEGRFPCVDGIRFKFDPSRPAGSRVVDGSVFVRKRVDHLVHRRGEEYHASSRNGDGIIFEAIDLNKTYHVVTKTYLLAGKDGYDAFLGAPIILDDELCPPLPTLVRNYFTELSVVRQWEGLTTSALQKAANMFERALHDDSIDQFAIEPLVDGRITNLQEA
ncbi:hypothetical protein MPSEU_000254400 [Mayamaea pseudoterrestris]|nr:hypothetical protein MPSEU_000254400 [Mayamaea pseudoterrestris]